MAYTVDDFHWLSLLDMAIFNSYVKLFKSITKEYCKMGPYRTPHYQQSGRQKKPELIASSRRQFGHCHPSFQFRMLFQHRPRSEEAPVLIKKRCCHRNCNCWAILSIKCGMNKPTNSFKSPCRKQAPSGTLVSVMGAPSPVRNGCEGRNPWRCPATSSKAERELRWT